MSKTLFITHPDCQLHNMGDEHLESPERLRAIIARLRQSGLMAKLDQVDAPKHPGLHPIAAAHDTKLWSAIERCAPTQGTRALAPEAIMSQGTLGAISRGVGGSLMAVDRVVSGKNPNAFVAVRPPGHHATRAEAMGFCFVNNAAIAAYHALTLGLSRVAIVDIDVHHGNGTEDIVAGDPRLFMASTFGLGIYPGNGTRPLADNMSNAGLPRGTSGWRMREIALESVLLEVDAFAPELVIVSAGYDAHRDDPIGNQSWDDEDYGWWFEQLQTLANRHAKGRLVAILEGGYNVDALARGVEQSILAMGKAAGTL